MHNFSGNVVKISLDGSVLIKLHKPIKNTKFALANSDTVCEGERRLEIGMIAMGHGETINSTGLLAEKIFVQKPSGKNFVYQKK